MNELRKKIIDLLKTNPEGLSLSSLCVLIPSENRTAVLMEVGTLVLDGLVNFDPQRERQFWWRGIAEDAPPPNRCDCGKRYPEDVQLIVRIWLIDGSTVLCCSDCRDRRGAEMIIEDPCPWVGHSYVRRKIRIDGSEYTIAKGIAYSHAKESDT